MDKLDLHGVRHYEVDRMVENFILMNQDKVPLTIICGNSARMIQLAKQVTERLGCSTEMPFHGTILIRKI